MRGAYEMPTQQCPYCGTECDADWADVGVGMVQCGPYHCTECHASEIGSFDALRELSEAEKKTGWYKPGSEPGSSANVIHGKIVSHRQMKSAYQREFTGNPLWHNKDYVDDWWDKIRK